MYRPNKEVSEILKQLEKDDGIITPERVVELARDENNILHGWFQWDDTLAAESWRREQARQLINRVQVTIMGKERSAYENVFVTIRGVSTQGYVSTEKIAKNEDLRIQVKEAAIKEIKYWQQKYKDLDELSGIVNEEALSRVESTLLRTP